MKVTRDMDRMIDALKDAGTPAEHIIMGKICFREWIREMARTGEIIIDPAKRKYRFKHRNIPVIVCESDILEVVPNARHLLF
jgi:hypothetical protein